MCLQHTSSTRNSPYGMCDTDNRPISEVELHAMYLRYTPRGQFLRNCRNTRFSVWAMALLAVLLYSAHLKADCTSLIASRGSVLTSHITYRLSTTSATRLLLLRNEHMIALSPLAIPGFTRRTTDEPGMSTGHKIPSGNSAFICVHYRLKRRGPL